MASFTIGQWGMLAFTILVFLFMFATFFRCVGDSIKNKPLYMLLILVQCGVQVIYGPRIFRTSFSLMLLAASKWFIYPSGDNIIQVVLPVGAILYWLLRKRLIKKAAPQVRPAEVVGNEGFDAHFMSSDDASANAPQNPAPSKWHHPHPFNEISPANNANKEESIADIEDE